MRQRGGSGGALDGSTRTWPEEELPCILLVHSHARAHAAAAGRASATERGRVSREACCHVTWSPATNTAARVGRRIVRSEGRKAP